MATSTPSATLRAHAIRPMRAADLPRALSAFLERNPDLSVVTERIDLEVDSWHTRPSG